MRLVSLNNLVKVSRKRGYLLFGQVPAAEIGFVTAVVTGFGFLVPILRSEVFRHRAALLEPAPLLFEMTRIEELHRAGCPG
jgi:hypothetical protein